MFQICAPNPLRSSPFDDEQGLTDILLSTSTADLLLGKVQQYAKKPATLSGSGAESIMSVVNADERRQFQGSDVGGLTTGGNATGRRHQPSRPG